MHLSKGYLPSFFAIPAIILVFSGYILAFLYKFFDVELLPSGIAFSWLFCFIGLMVLGRTQESFDDERVNQIRNFSFRYLSDLFIWSLFFICLFGLFLDSWEGIETLPVILLIFLLAHLYYLKIAVLFDGIDETKGKLRMKYHLLFAPYLIVVGILNYTLFA